MIKLFDYQKEGVEFLRLRTHAMLADDMGLGKTYQAIAAAKLAGCERILVICPAVAKYNWQKEFAAFKWQARVLPEEGNWPVMICSFEFARKYPDMLRLNFDLIIVDEAHYLKEPTSARTKEILGSTGLIHYSKRLWAMSGTFAPNHAGELWVWLKTFGITKLSHEGFIARYCNAHREGHYARLQITGTNTKHSPELKAMLKRIAIRRLKSDVLTDLPSVCHSTYPIEGADDRDVWAMAPYLKDKLGSELEILKEKLGIDFDHNDERTLSTLQFLSQSISSLRRYHGFKKIKAACSLVEAELREQCYDKVVVFGLHTDVLETFCHIMREYNPLLVTGKTPPKLRQAAVENFQNNPHNKIFVGNILAAGTAITLTAAHQVLFIEQDWVPGNNRQAADRCHRIGQTLPVNVRYLAIKDSIDDKITATLVRKIKEISTFL